MATYTVQSSGDFDQVAKQLRPGDVVRVEPGLYERPARLDHAGSPEAPIVITAHRPGPISGGKAPDPWWGGDDPGLDSPRKPALGDFAFLILNGCRNIIVSGLEVRDCWPSIFFIKDSADIAIRNCRLRHGTYAIFLRGEAKAGKPDGTRGYVIEGNEWVQDDSPDHKLWTLHDWRESHGDEGSNGQYRYFNGGFVAGKNIAGDVVIRRNVVSDAYNGVRIKGDDAAPPPDIVPRINSNVHIYDNDFVRIRDNPIEPEVYAIDWHVRHNRLLDCHSWFSFDGVAGGYWYFYGNTGRFVSRQGADYESDHTMGRVLKLSYAAADPASRAYVTPNWPWYVFNNSWYLRCPLIGGAYDKLEGNPEGPDFTSHLDFFNNTFQWCLPGDHAPRVCEATDLVMNLDWQQCVNVSFDHDMSNRGDFKRFLSPVGGGGEPNGIVADRPIFRDPQAGDFMPAQNSQALQTGLVKPLRRSDGGEESLRTAGHRPLLNRGAWQDYGLTSVPGLEQDSERILSAAMREGSV